MSSEKPTKDLTVACYYFPNYHVDSRNGKVHGKDWTEWGLVKNARPRFEGHVQPKVPLWGYGDEADSEVMAMKIDAAADHGIDAFIFDWYWYNDGPFLERCLNEGFLGAKNRDKLKFALMWANHDWHDIHPATPHYVQQQAKGGGQNFLYPGRVTEKTFEYLTDLVIHEYFSQSNYWKIDNRPYFSVYELSMLVKSFGGIDGARRRLDRFREKTINAGFDGLHLNAVVFDETILPGEVALPVDQIAGRLGFDSCTSYVWIHHLEMDRFPEFNFLDAMRGYCARWDELVKKINVPYYPNITMGWDSSPRTVQTDAFENIGYPYMSMLADNTPENFKAALIAIKEKMVEKGAPIVNINCWNEWTEGSYLEPDTVHGMKYLEAIRDVFGT